MQIITDRSKLNNTPCAVALGFFDGVHLGHRAVIEAAVKSGCSPAVFTFNTHPRGDVELLTDTSRRCELFSALGVETAFIADFNEFCNMSAEDFFLFLKAEMHMKTACFGYNYRFGAGASGDAQKMLSLCAEAGIDAYAVAPVFINGMPVSSTAIRAFLEAGEPLAAAEMLGRKVCIGGTVVQGKHLGHSLGFATINQRLSPCDAAIRRGVYASEVSVGGQVFRAVTNIGARPTVMQSAEAAETHIIGFSGDLYGQALEVCLLKYLRPQQDFGDVKKLSEAISLDINAALDFMK